MTLFLPFFSAAHFGRAAEWTTEHSSSLTDHLTFASSSPSGIILPASSLASTTLMMRLRGQRLVHTSALGSVRHSSSSSAVAPSRTVFIRPQDGKHFISPAHTLAVVSQMAQKFGPIVDFHFPREPQGQRLLGYGSVTFATAEAMQKALSDGCIHILELPPRLPSRPPKSFLNNGREEPLAIHSHTTTTEALRNPMALRPGWHDLSPSLGDIRVAFSEEPPTSWNQVDDLPEQNDDYFHRIDTKPRLVEIKLERRVSAITVRPHPSYRNSPSQRSPERPGANSLENALKRFGGFQGGILEAFNRAKSERHARTEQPKRIQEEDPQNVQEEDPQNVDPDGLVDWIRNTVEEATEKTSSEPLSTPSKSDPSNFRHFSTSSFDQRDRPRTKSGRKVGFPVTRTSLLMVGAHRLFSTTASRAGSSDKAQRKAEWHRNRKVSVPCTPSRIVPPKRSHFFDS